jgi:hypothetical protein
LQFYKLQATLLHCHTLINLCVLKRLRYMEYYHVGSADDMELGIFFSRRKNTPEKSWNSDCTAIFFSKKQFFCNLYPNVDGVACAILKL